MKSLSYTLFAVLLLTATACQQPKTTSDPEKTLTPTTSQPATPTANGEPVKQALTKILELARLGDCASMAPLLAYSEGKGSDSWHRGLHYDVEEEKLVAEKECAKLQVLVTGLEKYIFLEFVTEEEQEGEWLIWNVRFQYQGGETTEKAFAFLKVQNGYILGDID